MCLPIVYDFFHVTKAEMSPCDHMSHEVKSIYYLTLCKKSLSTLILGLISKYLRRESPEAKPLRWKERKRWT